MKIYTDGRPTKVAFIIEGERAIGKPEVIVASESHIVEIPFSTNFEAEYLSIIEALKWLVKNKERFTLGQHIIIINDNATVISQFLGKARVLEPRLKVLFDEAVSYIASFPYHIEFDWIEGERNKAHELFKR